MRFKAQEVVRGFQNMTYQIDGKEAATKVIFTDVVLREDAGGKGTRTQDRKCVDAEVIRAVEHLPFPLLAELDIEERATKNKSELFVLSIKPLKQLEPSPPKGRVMNPDALASLAFAHVVLLGVLAALPLALYACRRILN